MEIAQILSFLLASVLLALMPGPDNILVLTESITKGKKYGIALAAGLSSGVIIHTIAATTGISVLLQNIPIAFQLIKYFGAAYLIYLAYQAFHEQAIEVDGLKPEAFNFFKQARKGFLMNVLNPKVTLFFVAFLPQFLIKDGFPISIQMIILGVIFMVQAFLVFSGIAALAGKVSQLLNTPKFWARTKYVKIAVLLILAAFLLFID